MTAAHRGTRLAVVGCGHVGLVTAACMAHLGHDVTGIDLDATYVESLNAGRNPFVEPGLRELLRAQLVSGRLRFTTSMEDGLSGAECVFLCVNTPGAPTGAADLHYVREAVGTIAPVLARAGARPTLINKSTSPIGTAETIEGLVRRAFAGCGTEPPAIVANPEFLREGHAIEDFLQPDRIVIGGDDAAAAERAAALYAGIEAPVLHSGLRAAEMIKYVSNAFLATRVSFVNEIARLCEALGVDADAVVAGAAMDPRIGAAFFSPGIGFGGSCLPKDVAALCHTGDSAGVPLRVLSAVTEANRMQRKHAVNSLRQLLGGLEGRRVAAWGLTFKGGTEDLRESPALDVVSLLINDGADVCCFDPAAEPAELSHASSPLEAAIGADAVAILTDWPEFAAVDLRELRERMAGRVIYDGRNLLDRGPVEAAGLVYQGVGRPASAANSRRPATVDEHVGLHR